MDQVSLLTYDGSIDCIRVINKRRQTPRYKHLLDPLAKKREISNDAKTTKTLTEERPLLVFRSLLVP